MNTTASAIEGATPDRLPISGLLALAMTGFICIVTETLPAGLLPQISDDMGISPSMAGQTVTAYAFGSFLTAIPLTIATRAWRRRSVLLLAIIGFLVFNSATALSSDYHLTMTARFLAGVSAGLAWSLLAGYARRMVEPHQQGKAMAVAMVGTPLALSLGVPLGTWLATAIGWRATFGIASAMTLALVPWVLAKVPDFPGQAARERMPLRRVFTTPGVRPVLAVVLTWMLAHNLLYTYIAPFAAHANLGASVDLLLLTFGVAALAGISIAGKLVDGFLRRTVLASLAAFGAAALAFGLAANWPTAVYAGTALWGMTFGGAATLLQTALADAAGDGADVAQSMNVVVWNLAIAGAFPWAVQSLLAATLIIAWSARARAFRPGRRGA